jgi:predicted patatin/cPLA2 family phospholipase
MRLAKIRYPRYPGLCEALKNRHVRYNQTLDFIEDLEKKGGLSAVA